MGDTVAVALISVLPTATVALAALVGNFLLDERRRAHERGQLASQLEHEREMRLLEWKRTDRMERLAPIRGYVDAVSREITAYMIALRAPDSDPPANRIVAVLDQYVHLSWRFTTLDGQLSELLATVIEDTSALLDQNRDDKLVDRMLTNIGNLWDRLDELQSAL